MALGIDLEPEYLTVSHDSRTAWVTLQENNAVAVLDIEARRFTSLVALGFKDHALAGNALDPSDRDGGIRIANWPVLGMYQPDAIAALEYQGQTFFLTANEGDSRPSEETRVADVTLDFTRFPNALSLQNPANLGRLRITNLRGDTDGDGDFDELYAFGGRSFSIWSPSGELVFDSGDSFAGITAASVPGIFNSNGDSAASFDTRSDDKGSEPEGLVLGKVFGRTLPSLVSSASAESWCSTSPTRSSQHSCAMSTTTCPALQSPSATSRPKDCCSSRRRTARAASRSW